MQRRNFIKKSILGVVAGFLPSTILRGEIFSSLPKVLIIGDSISIGYTPFVRQELKNKAEVFHNEGNAQHTGTGLEMIDNWLGDVKWDVIHFNWGLWDLAYRHTSAQAYGNRDKVNGEITTSLEQYGENLGKLSSRLKETGAKLIWANTTPVPPGESLRIRSDEIRYNALAERIMRSNSIPVNDLHTCMIDHMNEYQVKYGDVHFTKEGYKYLADKVAKTIERELLSVN